MPLQNYNKKHLHFDFKSFTPKNDYSNRPTSILKNSTHYQRNRDEDMEEESSNEESQQYEEEEEEFGDSNEYEFNEDYYDCCEKLTKPTSGIAYIQWKKKQDLLRGPETLSLRTWKCSETLRPTLSSSASIYRPTRRSFMQTRSGSSSGEASKPHMQSIKSMLRASLIQEPRSTSWKRGFYVSTGTNTLGCSSFTLTRCHCFMDWVRRPRGSTFTSTTKQWNLSLSKA